MNILRQLIMLNKRDVILKTFKPFNFNRLYFMRNKNVKFSCYRSKQALGDPEG